MEEYFAIIRPMEGREILAFSYKNWKTNTVLKQQKPSGNQWFFPYSDSLIMLLGLGTSKLP